MMRIKRMLADQRGSALAFVVMILLVVFIMVSIVASIAQTNIKQAGSQEKGLQAYYAAKSGAEAAFAALWLTTSGGETGNTLLKELKDSKTFSPEQVVLPEGAGTADVSISYTKNGTEEEIVIGSRGSYGEVTRSVTLKVYFDEVTEDGTPKSVLKEVVWSR